MLMNTFKTIISAFPMEDQKLSDMKKEGFVLRFFNVVNNNGSLSHYYIFEREEKSTKKAASK